MNAQKDDNNVNTLIAALNTDGDTIIRVLADPTTHVLSVSNGTNGTDFGPANALKDDNNVSTLIATSSADGITPVVVYADSDGKLLIQST